LPFSSECCCRKFKNVRAAGVALFDFNRQAAEKAELRQIVCSVETGSRRLQGGTMNKAKVKSKKAKIESRSAIRAVHQFFLTILCFCAFAMNFHAQTGGAFTVEKSVIAAGGGTGAGGAFTVQGTAGQPATGISQSQSFSVFGGFITPNFAPTAASVAVSGRVFTPSGAGLRNAVVSMTDMQGNSRTARTSTFGYFRFEDVEAGGTYIFNVQSKSFQFTPQVVSVTDDLSELNFTAVF
jgi:Carboxypeptidase regulatory-like domain